MLEVTQLVDAELELKSKHLSLACSVIFSRDNTAPRAAVIIEPTFAEHFVKS